MTETQEVTVSGIKVSIVRKAIKNLHLGVYPPNGHVRVAAPLAVSNDAVRLAVIGRLGWIKRQQAKFKAQPRQSKRTMVDGESHYFLGRRYRLRIVELASAGAAVIPSRSVLELHLRSGSDTAARARLLHRWYRERLRELIPPLLTTWEARLGVTVNDWGIKRMKTKWGGCNVDARRIWLNLELAKKPVTCLEYVIVHELSHLLERHHNDRFTALMDRHLPTWRQVRQELNSAPLAHETWGAGPDSPHGL
ncbi:MAG: M48 family metallopeptidase [Candidatus Sericytochromatia bacterium]|nr:M48 family metallopeptidase [Candidatus Sericytochromatia bacterium]